MYAHRLISWWPFYWLNTVCWWVEHCLLMGWTLSVDGLMLKLNYAVCKTNWTTSLTKNKVEFRPTQNSIPKAIKSMQLKFNHICTEAWIIKFDESGAVNRAHNFLVRIRSASMFVQLLNPIVPMMLPLTNILLVLF